jgi:CSLREA domain-containing protein
MRTRSWLFRLAGLGFLGLGLAVAVAGAGAYPYPPPTYLSWRGLGGPTEASAYYAAIGAPATFAQWYALYFPNTVNTVEARYYNAADLGFGREMHCREQFEFTACYVVNHGLGAGAPAELAVQDAVADARELPTVAMVYDFTINGQPNDVRFYIYDPAGNLIPNVPLDSQGDKYVPHVCLPCHGGTLAANSVSGASFLPFDAASFIYSTQPGYTRADQEEALRRLNGFVYRSLPAAQIRTLIEGWYGGAANLNTPGAVLNDAYLPATYDGSEADRALYRQVVKPYCRGCHVAQNLTLEAPAQLGFVPAFNAVYGASTMPHAEVTAHDFWSSSAPAVLARSRGWAWRVTTLEDTPPPYSCHIAPCSLREAVLSANATNDLSIIVFDVDGVFRLAQAGEDDSGNAGDLDIREDLILLGNGAHQTVLDGGSLDRVLHVLNGAEVVIQGVTVQGGRAAYAGGGLRNDGSTLTLNFSVVRNNQSTALGFSGGGLAALTGARTYINQSTIGPGNVGANLGGGIFNDGSTIVIRNSTLTGNTGRTGGALHNNYHSTATLIQTTVVFNRASVNGGGTATEEGSLTNLMGSILGGNTSPGQVDCYVNGATYTSLGNNLVGQNGSAGGCALSGSDRVLAGSMEHAVNTALSTDPASGVTLHALRGGNPALDAIPLGSQCATPSYDARNLARPRDAGGDGSLGCDIGAVEMETVVWEVFVPLAVR